MRTTSYTDICRKPWRMLSKKNETVEEFNMNLGFLRACYDISQLLLRQSTEGQAYKRLKSHLDKHGRVALLCRACHDRADDPVLLQCGHIYCFECVEQIKSCLVQGCYENNVPFIDVSAQMDAIDAILGYYPAGGEPDYDSDQDSDVVFLGHTAPESVHETRVRSQAKIKSDPEVVEIDSDSEDDGFENRSQRSVGYDDDGNSFVADDSSSIGADYEVNTEVELPEGMSQKQYDDIIDRQEIDRSEGWKQELDEEMMDLF